jgi:hypothetical protein
MPEAPSTRRTKRGIPRFALVSAQNSALHLKEKCKQFADQGSACARSQKVN